MLNCKLKIYTDIQLNWWCKGLMVANGNFHFVSFLLSQNQTMSFPLKLLVLTKRQRLRSVWPVRTCKYLITMKMNKNFKLHAKFDDYILNNSYLNVSVEDFWIGRHLEITIHSPFWEKCRSFFAHGRLVGGLEKCCNRHNEAQVGLP